MKTALFTVTISVLCFISSAFAQVFTADNGYVEFESRAPLLTFKGISNQLHGFVNLSTGEVDFYVDLSTLSTNNRRRDRDMRQIYLETDRFPFAEFSGILTSPFDSESNITQPAIVEGKFTMRGISRPFTAEGTIQQNEAGLLIEASWQILLQDFNIDRPRIVFYELSDVQQVSIKITLAPEL